MDFGKKKPICRAFEFVENEFFFGYMQIKPITGNYTTSKKKKRIPNEYRTFVTKSFVYLISSTVW